jgi:hypothetical protein
MNRPVPTPLLEQLRLGELPPEIATRLRAELSEADAARMAALDADDAETLARHPPHLATTTIRRRAEAAAAKKRGHVGWWLALPALAACALVFVVLQPPGVETQPKTLGGVGASVDEGVRAKGDARLLVFRRTASGSEPMASGANARAGDELRLGFFVEAPSDAVLVSLDGRGVTTPHFPLSGTGAGKAAQGRTLLDTAYALDDAPSFERFVLVVGPNVTVERVVEAARAVARAPTASTDRLPLPAEWTQTDFLVRKTASNAQGPNGPRSPHP